MKDALTTILYSYGLVNYFHKAALNKQYKLKRERKYDTSKDLKKVNEIINHTSIFLRSIEKNCSEELDKYCVKGLVASKVYLPITKNGKISYMNDSNKVVKSKYQEYLSLEKMLESISIISKNKPKYKLIAGVNCSSTTLKIIKHALPIKFKKNFHIPIICTPQNTYNKILKLEKRILNHSSLINRVKKFNKKLRRKISLKLKGKKISMFFKGFRLSGVWSKLKKILSPKKRSEKYKRLK